MLAINNLEAGYNGTNVLSIKDLNILKGQSWLLRGESGSGKTTLLNVIAGLHKPDTGIVSINNVSLYDLNEAERDKFRGNYIGLVFQTLHLVKPLTVMENILLGAYAKKSEQDVTWAEYLLEKVGVADLSHKSATEISQGQAQRVALARALINKPPILLADEPTSSLDNKSVDTVTDLLKSFSSEFETTLVVTSHDDRLMRHFTYTLEIGV